MTGKHDYSYCIVCVDCIAMYTDLARSFGARWYSIADAAASALAVT